MAAEKFRAAEDAFFALRGQFDTGRITREQFDEKLREQAVQDALGRYWMLGADSGHWYFYDGAQWVQADPPDHAANAPLASQSTYASPITAAPAGKEAFYNPPVLAAVREDGRALPLVLILFGFAIVALCIGAFLLFQNRGRIFVAQQPPAQITPNQLPTREPTAQLPVVLPTKHAPSNIPTITPFTLSTPVPRPPAPLTVSASTSFFSPSPTAPPTGRLRVGNGSDAGSRYMPVSQFILDGSFSEWSGDGVPLTIPHFGADNWLGPRDLSGTVWLGWNEKFLLIAVNVLDDAHVQTQRSWEMFRGDSVELWIDADLGGDFDVATGNEDDYQFGFSPGDFAGLPPEGVLYIPYRDAIVNQQILVAAQPNSAGYTIEAAVPWAVLRVQPDKGRVLGYAVDLSDNDVPLTAQQQTQVTESPNFQFQMPATFGNLILE